MVLASEPKNESQKVSLWLSKLNLTNFCNKAQSALILQDKQKSNNLAHDQIGLHSYYQEGEQHQETD